MPHWRPVWITTTFNNISMFTFNIFCNNLQTIHWNSDYKYTTIFTKSIFVKTQILPMCFYTWSNNDLHSVHIILKGKTSCVFWKLTFYNFIWRFSYLCSVFTVKKNTNTKSIGQTGFFPFFSLSIIVTPLLCVNGHHL